MIRITTNAEVSKRIARLPSMLQIATERTLSNAVIEIVRIMRRSGLSIKYPVRWDSEKQRRAYFATNVFGKGIPYRRTGAYEDAWKSEAITGGYMVSNVGHKAVFMAGTATGIGIGGKVTSTGQSHIHQGRWRLFRPVLVAVLSKLPLKLREAFAVEFNSNV